jgi:hypothetical protein
VSLGCEKVQEQLSDLVCCVHFALSCALFLIFLPERHGIGKIITNFMIFRKN